MVTEILICLEIDFIISGFWGLLEVFLSSLAKFINGQRHIRSHQHKRFNDGPDVSILTRHIELVVMVIFQFGSNYFSPGSCTNVSVFKMRQLK